MSQAEKSLLISVVPHDPKSILNPEKPCVSCKYDLLCVNGTHNRQGRGDSSDLFLYFLQLILF